MIKKQKMNKTNIFLKFFNQTAINIIFEKWDYEFFIKHFPSFDVKQNKNHNNNKKQTVFVPSKAKQAHFSPYSPWF